MQRKGRYEIRRVDEDEYHDEIRQMQKDTGLPVATYADVRWWLAFFEGVPVAYCGLMPSSLWRNAAYLVRVGVLKKHRGNKLQLRLMRAAERFARREGYEYVISDTRDNAPSTNNFIKAGYDTFIPKPPFKWSFEEAIYWKKSLFPC